MSRLWLFGGSGAASGQRFNDLWMFNMDLQIWSELAGDNETSPPAMDDHIAVWDSGGLALWIFGGNDGTEFLQDLWKFTAGTWTRVPTSLAPGRRAGHVAAWDDVSAALWIHGGYSGYDIADLHQDTWRFDSSGVDGWSRISSVSVSPSARAQHVGAWDAAGAFWIHGGYNGSVCNDLWKLQVGTSLWHRVAPVNSAGPLGRMYHAAAWDGTTGVWWIHGGVDENHIPQGDLWGFHTASHSWFQVSLLAPFWGPLGRYNHVATWVADGLWIHGGQQPSGSMRMDLWSYEPGSAAFTSFTESTVTSSPGSPTGSTTSMSTVVAEAAAGLNPVSWAILLVACVGLCTLLVLMALMAMTFGGHLKRLLTPFKRTAVMPLRESNSQLLMEPPISLPLPVPPVPMAVEFRDLPALYGDGEWVLDIPEATDGVGMSHPGRRCDVCLRNRFACARTCGPAASATAPAPSVAQGASRPCNWKGPGRKTMLRDSQEGGECLPALPAPIGQASGPSLFEPQLSVEEPSRSEMIWRCAALQCPSPPIALPDLTLQGPRKISELAPVLWRPPVPPPVAFRAPLPMPGGGAPPTPATDVPGRPFVPLATQYAELLMEPAMNPDPPGAPPEPPPRPRRRRSGHLDTTLGGPYWTAPGRTPTPPGLKRSPGPAHYNPQIRDIRGWIPGHGFGPPTRHR
eukprot:s2495_g9.t1